MHPDAPATPGPARRRVTARLAAVAAGATPAGQQVIPTQDNVFGVAAGGGHLYWTDNFANDGKVGGHGGCHV